MLLLACHAVTNAQDTKDRFFALFTEAIRAVVELEEPVKAANPSPAVIADHVRRVKVCVGGGGGCLVTSVHRDHKLTPHSLAMAQVAKKMYELREALKGNEFAQRGDTLTELDTLVMGGNRHTGSERE